MTWVPFTDGLLDDAILYTTSFRNTVNGTIEFSFQLEGGIRQGDSTLHYIIIWAEYLGRYIHFYVHCKNNRGYVLSLIKVVLIFLI